MRCEERLFEQAQAFKAARPPSAHSWVYRNTCMYGEGRERERE